MPNTSVKSLYAPGLFSFILLNASTKFLGVAPAGAGAGGAPAGGFGCVGGCVGGAFGSSCSVFGATYFFRVSYCFFVINPFGYVSTTLPSSL